MKRLIVNADDFGFTSDVNRGIIQAHREGIVTSATLMACGAAFDDAVKLAREHPALDVGIHLVLVAERSLSRPGVELPATPWRLVAALAAGALDVAGELEAQIRRLLHAGIEPTHADTHKHTHVYPPVADAVARLAARHGIPWVRRPIPVPLLRRIAESRITRQGRRMADHFVGFEQTGTLDERSLTALIARAGDGITELMCHPGICSSDLRRARTRLKESRQRELDALLAPGVRRALDEAGVELGSYRGFPACS